MHSKNFDSLRMKALGLESQLCPADGEIFLFFFLEPNNMNNTLFYRSYGIHWRIDASLPIKQNRTGRDRTRVEGAERDVTAQNSTQKNSIA